MTTFEIKMIIIHLSGEKLFLINSIPLYYGYSCITIFSIYKRLLLNRLRYFLIQDFFLLFEAVLDFLNQCLFLKHLTAKEVKTHERQFLIGRDGGSWNWKYLKKYVWILLNWDLNIFIFFVCLYVLIFFIKRNIYFKAVIRFSGLTLYL